MADERVVQAVKISDPTTPSQQAAVDSSGNLQIDIAAVSTTLTVDTELPAAAALTDNFANPTAPAVGAFLMLWDTATWDRAPGTAADGLLVNLGANNDVVVSGTVTADTELPAAAALSDTFANPTAPAVGAFLMGWDATDWARIWSIRDGDAVNAAAAGFLVFGADGSSYLPLLTDATGALQVDVLSGGGSTTPVNPVSEGANSTNTAAGASDDLDSSELAGETRALWQVTMTASVPFKGEIGAYEDGNLVASYGTIFGRAGDTVIWKPSHPDFATNVFGTNAGFDGFRVVATNMDTSEAADIYAQFEYADG